MEIEKASFPSPWPKSLFLQEMSNPRARLRAARNRDQILAYTALFQVLDEVHLTSIAVHLRFRRQGIGTHLLLQVLSECYARKGRILYLEVRQNNYPAHSFYSRLKLNPIGVRRGYYQDTGEDAFILSGEIESILASDV